jgi:hypothetical protein
LNWEDGGNLEVLAVLSHFSELTKLKVVWPEDAPSWMPQAEVDFSYSQQGFFHPWKLVNIYARVGNTNWPTSSERQIF